MWEIEDLDNSAATERIEPTVPSLWLHKEEVCQPEKNSTVRKKYLFALGASTLLHMAVFALLLPMRIEPPRVPVANNNSLLLRLAPPSSEAPMFPDDTVVPETSPLPQTPAIPEPPPTSEPQIRQPSLVDVPLVAPTIEFSIPLPSEDVDFPIAPSTMQLRQIVESINSSNEVSAQRLSCTPAQKRSEFFDCPDDTQTAGYAAPSNLTADYLNQRSGSISEQQRNSERMRQVASSLSANGLNSDEVKAFIDAIDTSRQELNTSTPARVSGLRDQMLMNDSTHQIVKRVFNP